MELLDGVDLQELVQTHGPLPASRVVHVLRQACHSLAEAHSAGLVHRDIKPANIFGCRHGSDVDFVKVLDFGLVKHDKAGDETDPDLSREGSIIGTPAYLCPEAITGQSPVDHRSDIYSMGCVAYWLLTGELVFTAKTSMAMLTEHATAQPVPPSQRSELLIPEALDDVVLACLAKQPGDRPDGANELAERLEGIGFEKPWENERARAWWGLHRIH
jgi:serine/threonine-protein kinase